MSALYGFIPNTVQQHNPPKPTASDPIGPQRTEITRETAPAISTKVAEVFEQDHARRSSGDAEKNAEKSAHIARLAQASEHSPDTPKLAAQSKVAATDPPQDAPMTPADLAADRAEDLARAREQATQYREYKERLESTQANHPPTLDKDGNPQPKLDVRIPLPDEMPDRPLPRLGVPTV